MPKLIIDNIEIEVPKDTKLIEAARRFIAETAYDPVYGARPLKRYLQHTLETRIARALIGGEIGEGATITVDVEAGGLSVSHRNPPQETAEAPAAS